MLSVTDVKTSDGAEDKAAAAKTEPQTAAPEEPAIGPALPPSSLKRPAPDSDSQPAQAQAPPQAPVVAAAAPAQRRRTVVATTTVVAAAAPTRRPEAAVAAAAAAARAASVGAGVGAGAGAGAAAVAAAVSGAGAGVGAGAGAGAGADAAAQQMAANGKKKKFFRAAAGKRWEDKTLAEFPAGDTRLFVGNLGNEVSDAILAGA